jgi:hypothetical protein
MTDDREEIACPACGEFILATAKKCKHCGEWLDARATLTADQQRSGNPAPTIAMDQTLIRAQSSFEPVLGETVLKDGLSQYVKSTLNVQDARCFITSSRFVCCAQGKLSQAAFGVAGLVAKALVSRPTITFQILWEDVTKIEKGSHMLAETVTFFAERSTAYTVKFNLIGRNEWYAALNAVSSVKW